MREPLLAMPSSSLSPGAWRVSPPYALEAVPRSGRAPQVLAQGIHEVAQLLWAHGHLLPDQLQMLRGQSEWGPVTGAGRESPPPPKATSSPRAWWSPEPPKQGVVPANLVRKGASPCWCLRHPRAAAAGQTTASETSPTWPW